ncbi:MAG TPA: cupin domain-containing protein [Microbacterium sp.]|nr:cupin domain-containing protein [Microbacterium sp.]
MSTDIATITRAGAIYKASEGAKNLPSMNEPGVEAWIGDSFHNPDGSVLSSGFFELKAGAPLIYEYTYDETKFVVRGTFILTDVSTGESLRAEPGEVLFFPKGTIVKFETDDVALGFYAGDRSFAP